MTAQTRATLYTYFQTGDKPTQTQFANFVDSALNIATTSGQAITSDVSALRNLDIALGMTCGNPTGGNKGTGTLNVSNALYVNGTIVTVGSAAGSGTVNTGSTNQIAYYPSNSNSVSGTNSLPAGTTLNGNSIINKINVQIITSTATYTRTSGTQYAIVEMVGGGGGGGSVAASSNVGAGGGGNGGYLKAFLTAAQLGASQVVTINSGGGGGASGSNNAGTNGGSVSFGSLLSCNGGLGGGAGSSQVSGGAGGTATVSTGTTIVAFTGQAGGVGAGSASFSFGGAGGSNPLGLGAQSAPAVAGNSDNGLNATGYGAGGGGSSNCDGTSQAGGNGSNGIVIVIEFISA